jgi:hypothetical protein
MHMLNMTPSCYIPLTHLHTLTHKDGHTLTHTTAGQQGLALTPCTPWGVAERAALACSKHIRGCCGNTTNTHTCTHALCPSRGLRPPHNRQTRSHSRFPPGLTRPPVLVCLKPCPTHSTYSSRLPSTALHSSSLHHTPSCHPDPHLPRPSTQIPRNNSAAAATAGAASKQPRRR